MKKAFSMIELIIVIVVIGILAVVMIPRIGSNRVYEAATQLASHIRYTQHLAMVDDKFESTDSNWSKKLWQIRFNNGSYSIVSDGAYAKNPMNRDNLDINISQDYGVTLAFSNCGDNVISFDHVGRPLIDDLSTISSAYANLMTSDCLITLSDDLEEAEITIMKESGYISLK
jgi:prepilin-type N-terminal cleavage/methylation domain-containing protein